MLLLTVSFLIQLIRRFWKTLLLVIIVSSATLLLSALAALWLSSFNNLYFPSLGNVRVIGVEAYGDDITISSDGKQFINWGTVYLGTPVTRSFYIKSVSNRPIILELAFSNLTFQNSEGKMIVEKLPMENPLCLTWNYTGALLEPEEEVYVTVTLEIPSDPVFIRYMIENDVQSFCFDMIVRPVEG